MGAGRPDPCLEGGGGLRLQISEFRLQIAERSGRVRCGGCLGADDLLHPGVGVDFQFSARHRLSGGPVELADCPESLAASAGGTGERCLRRRPAAAGLGVGGGAGLGGESGPGKSSRPGSTSPIPWRNVKVIDII